MANTELYNSVKKVLSAKNEVEARGFLFGEDGIGFNSRDYYQRIITEFGRKKETIMPRDLNKTILFDLEKNQQEIWNIIYLGSMILKNNKINYNVLKEIDSVDIHVPPNAGAIDESSIIELKKAIRVIQRLKDSTKHNKYKVNEEECKIIVNNPSGKLEVDIPIRLLEQFNIGMIIPSRDEQDQALVKQAQRATNNILQALNNDITQLPNFFYSVSPDVMELLLQYVDNDIKKLYSLQYQLFSYSKEQLIQIINKYGKYDLSTYPPGFFNYLDVTDDFVKKYSLEVVKTFPEHFFQNYVQTKRWLDLYPVEEVKKFPKIFFTNQFSVMGWILDGYSIDELLTWPEFMFINNAETKRWLKHYSVEEVKNMPSYSLVFFDNVKAFIDAGYSLEEIKKFPVEFFVDCNMALAWLDKYSIDFYKGFPKSILFCSKALDSWLKTRPLEEVKTFPIEFFTRPHETLEWLKKYSIEEVKEFPSYFFTHYKETEKWLKQYPFDEVKEFPREFFTRRSITKYLIKRIGIEKTKLLISDAFYYDYEDIITVTSMINEYGIDLVNKLLAESTYYPSFIDRLNDLVSIVNEKYKDKGKEFVIRLTAKISKFYFYKVIKFTNLDILLEKVGYDIDRLDEFPMEFFEVNEPILKEYLEKYDYNICKSIFGFDDPKTIALVVYMDKVLKGYQKSEHEPNTDKAFISASNFKNDQDLEAYLEEGLPEITKTIKFDLKQLRYAVEKNNSLIDKTESKVLKNHAKFIVELNRRLSNYAHIAMFRLRNAMSHYYFKPLENNKMLIWNEDLEGNRVYEKVYDMDELLEFVHSVEEFLAGKRDNSHVLDMCDKFGFFCPSIEKFKELLVEINELEEEKNKLIVQENEEDEHKL